VLALVLAALVASPAAAPSDPAITLDVRGKACALERALVAPLGELGLRVVPRDRPAALALRVDVEARTLRAVLVRRRPLDAATSTAGAAASPRGDALVERSWARAPTCGADVDTLTWIVEAQLRDLGFTPPPRVRRGGEGALGATPAIPPRGPEPLRTPEAPRAAGTATAAPPRASAADAAPATPPIEARANTPSPADAPRPEGTREPAGTEPEPQAATAPPRTEPTSPTPTAEDEEPTRPLDQAASTAVGGTPTRADLASPSAAPTTRTATGASAPIVRGVEAAIELGGDLDAASAPRLALRAALVLGAPIAVVDALAVGLRVTLGLPVDADVLVRDELRGTLSLVRGALDLSFGPRWAVGPGTLWAHALVGAELARATSSGALLFRAVDATRVAPLFGGELGYRLDTRWGPLLGPSLSFGVVGRPSAPSFGVEDASARLAVPPVSLQLRVGAWFGGFD
jgi:hypothetical protein